MKDGGRKERREDGRSVASSKTYGKEKKGFGSLWREQLLWLHEKTTAFLSNDRLVCDVHIKTRVCERWQRRSRVCLIYEKFTRRIVTGRKCAATKMEVTEEEEPAAASRAWNNEQAAGEDLPGALVVTPATPPQLAQHHHSLSHLHCHRLQQARQRCSTQRGG